MIDFTDTDLYKFSLLRGVLLTDINKTAKYRLIFRNKPGQLYFDNLFVEQFEKWLKKYQKVNKYGANAEQISFILDSLEVSYRDPFANFISKWSHKKDYNVHYGITKDNLFYLEYYGSWLNTILHEVPFMAAISKIYYKTYDPVALSNYKENAQTEWSDCQSKLTEMGTRRRISLEHQEQALRGLMEDGKIEATSNIFLAQKYNLKCPNSIAHEWFMAKGNQQGLEDWLKLGYKVNTVLTDTFTTDRFLQEVKFETFNKFDVIKHDSGDYRLFMDKLHTYFHNNSGDLHNKKIKFTDSLYSEKVNKIQTAYSPTYDIGFGVGSNISCLTTPRLNMVIKPIEFNGKAVHKLSDDPEKST